MAASQVQKSSQVFSRLRSYFAAMKNEKARCRVFYNCVLINHPKANVTKIPMKLRKITLGPSLALLGFNLWNQEEKLSENDQVRQIVSRGIMAKQNNNPAEASTAFHEALTKSTDFLNEKKITLDDHLNHRVFIYDQIANLALDIGDFEGAEAVFKDTMKLALQLGMEETDNAMIEMSLKLASIYLYTGRTELGVLGLKHCITEQENKLEGKSVSKTEEPAKTGDKTKVLTDGKPVSTEELKETEDNTRVLLGKALKHLANHHLQKRDFKTAESLMERSLEISRSLLGDSHDNTFVLMNDIATCQIMQKEYEKAERLLQEAIKYSGKAKSLMQSALLSNLGALYIRTKEFDKAELACKRGLRVAERGNDEYLKGPCQACLNKLKELNSSKQKE